MDEPRYPAARIHASRLRDHFAREFGGAAALGPGGSVLPDANTVEALVDAGFWASLQREEGYAPEISLAFLPPERAVHPMLLAEPLALSPRALARLAPAVERPGIHLGVWRDGDRPLVVWGTTRAVPSACLVLEVLRPGLLVVKHRIREDSPKFRNVAVFEGEHVKLVSRQIQSAADAPAPLRSLLWHDTPDALPSQRGDILLRLAVSMRSHKRGGTLLVVPAGSEAWRESIVRPIPYAIQPLFTELADLVCAAPEDAVRLGRVVEAMAGLTAVDGATLINDRFELLAFGAKIGRPDGRPRVERVALSEPVEGDVPAVVATLHLGGTRHNSAAQFAQDQPDATAMVASQDGRFTLFAWSQRESLVQAYQIEALLL